MFAHLEILLKQSQARLFNQIILTFFSAIYPFGVVFKSEFLPIIALFLAVLWSIKAYFDKNNSYFLIAMCFILVSFFRNFAFFYLLIIDITPISWSASSAPIVSPLILLSAKATSSGTFLSK